MSVRTAIRTALAALAIAAAGCGSSTAPGLAGRSDRLVDFSKPPPYVNAFDIDPKTKDFLLATNRGFYRIGHDSGHVHPIRGTVSVGDRRATVGSFLEFAATGPGRLIGSGHPDQEGALPPLLGVISSDDAGHTWTVVSRLGEADLHTIVLKHGRTYAFDAALGALVVSPDGGRTFTEQYTPRAPILDLEVDPADPQHVVVAGEQELFDSRDGGETWRALDRHQGVRLAWPAADALFRALKDGAVQRSADGAKTWQLAGRVAGEPDRFKPVGRDELYLALTDATIMHTTDGGRTWTVAFAP